MGNIGMDIGIDELLAQHRDGLRIIADQAVRIAELAAALEEAQEKLRTVTTGVVADVMDALITGKVRSVSVNITLQKEPDDVHTCAPGEVG